MMGAGATGHAIPSDDRMTQQRRFSDVLSRLKAVGLRPERQRLALARLLFEGENRHVTAEGLHAEARAAVNSIGHAHYVRMARLPEPVRSALAGDFT